MQLDILKGQEGVVLLPLCFLLGIIPKNFRCKIEVSNLLFKLFEVQKASQKDLGFMLDLLSSTNICRSIK